MARGQALRITAFNHIAEDMPSAVQSFLSYCMCKNLSSQTIQYYRYRLDAFTRYLDQTAQCTAPNDVTLQLLRAFITHETQYNSPSTANHSIITLRVFFNYLVNDGFLETSPMMGIEKVRQRKTVIETLTMDQVESVLATCRKDFIGIRDRALILVLLDCGLRVSELCSLTLDDLSFSEQTLLVIGKGDKERIVPFGQSVRQALVQYLDRRGELDTKSIFVNCYGNPLDRYRVREIIKDRCKTAGVIGVRCSPHTFRHTFAVSYLRAGGDVFSLQKLLGHSDLAMTRRYCELSQMDVVDKHRLYSPADRLKVSDRTLRRTRLK